MNVGSPEWYKDRANKKEDYISGINLIENRRALFLERFSPEKLAAMDGETLLEEVFDSKDECMIRLLMFDDDYRWFGAAGKYVYLGVLFKEAGKRWKYKEGVNSVEVSYDEAKEKAIKIRDDLLYCVATIERIGVFKTTNEYELLDNALSRVFFSKYAWTLKYYQMLYPQFFPGMYADSTIDRALKLIGLPHTGSRIVNAGQISLFIRRCDINNILFNWIYSDEWGWDSNYTTLCENARENYDMRNVPVETVNLTYYKFKRDSGNNSDINVPLAPRAIVKKNEKYIITCNRCGSDFEQSNRCTTCGQLLKWPS